MDFVFDFPVEILEVIISFTTEPADLVAFYYTSKKYRPLLTEEHLDQCLLISLPAQYVYLRFTSKKNWSSIKYLRLIANRMCTYCNIVDTHILLNIQLRLCDHCLDIQSIENRDVSGDMSQMMFRAGYEALHGEAVCADRTDEAVVGNPRASLRFRMTDYLKVASEFIRQHPAKITFRHRIEDFQSRLFENIRKSKFLLTTSPRRFNAYRTYISSERKDRDDEFALNYAKDNE